ncbi:phosphoadenylyl-sulfate reductase [Litoribacter ruber]|uniref:phosphoadenylyl-sulfate reductase n=1 Tax=Litoribacter ruber TaxID=702568 RepID=UPI00293D46F6|nr:phosphoadenylyl-sulfate reductase [Litoribacter ruber]
MTTTESQRNMKSTVAKLNTALTSLSPGDGLREVASLFPQGVVFSTSLGQEDQVLTHLIAKENLPIHIFTLDTGRLFPETLDLLARTEAKYGNKIQVYYPESRDLESLVAQQGINGFYASPENRKSCCYARKVAPLKRALKGQKVWVTGLRATQNQNRGQMNKIEWDESNQIIKYNPLLDWSFEEVLTFIEAHKVPYNPLHDKGFISIGCAPCTRAIGPDEDPRAGRWWWESSSKECGLHTK